MTERRSAVRQRSFLKGIAWYNNRAASVDCTIRDISEYGARLVLAFPASLPNAIEVDIPSKDQRVEATVRWRNGREVGISFNRAGARSASAGAEADIGDIDTRVARLEVEVDKLRRALGKLRVDLLRTISDRDLTTE